MLTFRDRRDGRFSGAPFWHFALIIGLRRGHAKTEANETNEREGHTNGPAPFGAVMSERLKISKTSVLTLLLRTREAGLSGWPLPTGLLERTHCLSGVCFAGVGRPPQDLDEPDWAMISRELMAHAS
ncbi:MAG: hypothetical protein E5Y73_27710 [Mesorhizobium sp.]|nr:MAG: hypothetical protein E5Y73_27710 [Mesorhizobium sp.]TIR29082.1 MAG: hypothetical protein E5X35_28105 [Mesorhizobium sp.]